MASMCLHDFLAPKVEGRRVLSRAIGRGVLVKALTTMIGFGTLMISSQRGLVGLGFCLTLGVGCCMLAALVFLPAVLQTLGNPRDFDHRSPSLRSRTTSRVASGISHQRCPGKAAQGQLAERVPPWVDRHHPYTLHAASVRREEIEHEERFAWD